MEGDLRRLIESMTWTDAGPLSIPLKDQRQRVMDMEYMWVQIGWSEISGKPGRLGDVILGLERFTKTEIISGVSIISNEILKRGTPAQASFLDRFKSTPTGKRVRKLYDQDREEWKKRTIFSPKHLAGLAKLAIAYSPSSLLDEESIRGNQANELFLQIYLKLVDVIEATSHPDGENDPRSNVLRYWIQEGEYGEGGWIAEELVRIDTLLRKIPRDLGFSSTPSEYFEAVSSMPLRRFMKLAFFIFAKSASMDVTEPKSVAEGAFSYPEELAHLTKATADEINWVFDKLVLTEEDAQEFRQDDPRSATYYTDFRALRLKPLWKVSTPSGFGYIPIVMHFLRWRITEGLYWDVADAIRLRGGNKAVSKFMTDFGDYLQEYVRRLFERALPSSQILGQRYHTQVTSGDQHPEIDLLIPYDNGCVVSEIKSARFHYINSVVQGNLDHIRDSDLEKMFFGPAAQLDKAIEHLRSGKFKLDGEMCEENEVLPVLITYGALPTLGVTWASLLDELKDRNILQAPYIRRLAALQVGEVEILAALADKGHSVREVIKQYVTGEYSNASFRNYVMQDYSDTLDLRDFLKPDFEAWLDEVKSILVQP